MADLKAHPFFQGIDWARLPTSTAPFQPDPADLPDPEQMTDGAFDDWLFEGDATEIDPMELGFANLRAAPAPPAPRKSGGGVWDRLLAKGETEVFSSTVLKRKVRLQRHIPCLCADMHPWLCRE